MVDNIEIIKRLLNFEGEGDFYMLYVMKRKKDQFESERDQHQSVRIIKSYCISSLEYLDKRYDEIKQLCEMFKARSYIHIQKQNHNDVALEMIPAIIKRIQSGQINQKHVFDSVVGQLKTYEKRWVVDNVQDGKDNCEEYWVSPRKIEELYEACKHVLDEKEKAQEFLPTQSGFFFGGTGYDEFYLGDTKNTVEMLKLILDDMDQGGNLQYDLYYQSSW